MSLYFVSSAWAAISNAPAPGTTEPVIPYHSVIGLISKKLLNKYTDKDRVTIHTKIAKSAALHSLGGSTNEVCVDHVAMF